MFYKCFTGIDYTMSNKVQGEKTFGGRSLHDIDEDEELLNPYQEVMSVRPSACPSVCRPPGRLSLRMVGEFEARIMRGYVHRPMQDK